MLYLLIIDRKSVNSCQDITKTKKFAQVTPKNYVYYNFEFNIFIKKLYNLYKDLLNLKF